MPPPPSSSTRFRLHPWTLSADPAPPQRVARRFASVAAERDFVRFRVTNARIAAPLVLSAVNCLYDFSFFASSTSRLAGAARLASSVVMLIGIVLEIVLVLCRRPQPPVADPPSDATSGGDDVSEENQRNSPDDNARASEWQSYCEQHAAVALRHERITSVAHAVRIALINAAMTGTMWAYCASEHPSQPRDDCTAKEFVPAVAQVALFNIVVLPRLIWIAPVSALALLTYTAETAISGLYQSQLDYVLDFIVNVVFIGAFVAIANGAYDIQEGSHDSPSVTLMMTFDTLSGLMDGSTDGMQAFMAGQLRAEGDMMLATKLGEIFPN